jgi:hypothetical protein
MTKDEAMQIIFTSQQYREYMDALEDAKKHLSPEEWQEVVLTCECPSHYLFPLSPLLSAKTGNNPL